MIHLRAIDPSASWTYDLPCAGGVVRLVCRYITVRQLLQYREKRAAALDGGNDVVIVEALMDALRMVVRTCIPPGGEAARPDDLLDMLTLSELWELSHELAVRQSLAEEDLGKSESARPTAAAPSAANAEVAGA